MLPSIFISRSKHRTQEFVKALKDCSGNIFSESLIDFSLIPSTGLPDSGWLFFYSQTGVDFFIKQHDWNEIAAISLKIGVFGPKTGLYLRSKGYNVDFIGTGEAQSTATLFLKNDVQRVCYIKGSSSKDSLSALLGDQVSQTSINVYHNKPRAEFNIPKTDILVFTSPLNLETYFNRYPITTKQKVIVIGTTTAMKALELDINEVHIAKETTLESLADSVIQLCRTWEEKDR